MYKNPELKFDHLFTMTDCTGIIQHSKYSIPDLSTGYTTDDNARALIIACMLYDKYRDARFLHLITSYLAFLNFAQNPNGKFRNFMNYQRQFIEEEGSEDSFGRSLWALGFLTCFDNIPKGLLEPANQMIRNSIPNLSSLKAVRAICYSIIGLVHVYKKNNKLVTRKLIEELTEIVAAKFLSDKTDEWFWYENKITYANGIIPYALLKSYSILEKKKYLKIGLDILNFLDSICLDKGYLKLIGCNGWAVKGKAPAKFDEQPIDAADMVLAYSEAYKATKNVEYLEKTEICFKWFLGLNCHNVPLINPENGGCFDGLTKTGVNLNQGAESIFSYIISFLTAEEIGIAIPDLEKEKNETFDEAI
ncbi:MAG: glycosyltransferase [Deltaproteobacteria bacterium]